MQIVNTGSYSEILINYFLIIFRNTFTAIFLCHYYATNQNNPLL